MNAPLPGPGVMAHPELFDPICGMPAMRLPHLLITLLGLASVFLRPGHAEFALLSSEEKTNDVIRYNVVYTLDPAKTLPRVDRIVGASALDGEFPAVGLREEKPRDERGALLGLTDAGDLARIAAVSPPAAAGAFRIVPVRIGPLAAAHLIVDPAKLPGDGGPLRVEVEVTRAPGKSPLVKPKGMTRRMIDGLFLNGEAIDHISRAPSGTKVLADPPGEWRLTYRGPGLRLLRAELAAVGLPPAEHDLLDLVHGGARLPFVPLGDDAFWFVAPYGYSPRDGTDTTFATTGGVLPRLAMEERPAFPTLAPTGVEVALPRSRTFAPNLVYERSAVLPVGERLVMWRLTAGQSRTFDLALDDVLTTTTVRVRAMLLGFNIGLADPDHYVDLALDDVPLARESWKGRTVHLVDQVIDLDGIPGDGVVTLEHAIDGASPFDGGASVDIQNLESVTIDYTAYPRVDETGFVRIDVGPAGESRRVTVGGLPLGTAAEEVLVVEATDPANPVRISDVEVFPDSSGGGAVGFEVPAAGGVYLVQLVASLPVVDEVAPAETLPSLPAGRLDAVFVAPPDFHEALAPLEALVDGEVVYLDPKAAFNVYTGGRQNPAAITEALATLVSAAAEAAPFPVVLLVGHGSFDQRDDLGLQTGGQVHPFLEESIQTSSITIENPHDFGFGRLFGEDEFEDAIVARIPARTAGEVTIAVDRALAFHAVAADLRRAPRPGLFVTDDDPGFASDTTELVDIWERLGRPAGRVDLDPASDGTAERDAIVEALSSTAGGSAFVLYTGHGNFDRWAVERLLDVGDVPSIESAGVWPFVTTFTCLNGYFTFPGASGPTLAEAWTFEPGGGAIANISPSSIDFYTEQRRFSLAVMDTLAGAAPPGTTGELFLRSRLRFLADFPALGKTARLYLLFGDPLADLTVPAAPEHQPGWFVH